MYVANKMFREHIPNCCIVMDGLRPEVELNRKTGCTEPVIES